jgi:drug/metabolite transporter (DMT)-like permease
MMDINIFFQIGILVILFGVFTGASVVLTGDRSLISGSISPANIIKMILDWRFIVAMALAVGSRFTFIYINNRLLSIPSLAKNSTTITTFITAISYIFIIVANTLILKERLSINQFIGAGLILGGIFFMLK